MKERETVTKREEIDLVETTTVSYGGNNDSGNDDKEQSSPVSEPPSEAERLEANVRREERHIKCYSDTIDDAATGAAAAEAEALREQENTLLYQDQLIYYIKEQQSRSDAYAEEQQASRVEEPAIEYQTDVKAYSQSLESGSKAADTASPDNSTCEKEGPVGNGDPAEEIKENPDAPSPEEENKNDGSVLAEGGTSEVVVTSDTEEEILEAIAEEFEEEERESAPKPTAKRAPRRAPKRQSPSKPAPKKK